MKLSSQLIVMMTVVSMSIGCADINTPEAQSRSIEGKNDTADKVDETSRTDSLFSFETPLGKTLLDLSRTWEQEQVNFKDEYAQPRMCAHNVSHVLDMAELFAYGSYLVPTMLSAVKARGGDVTQLPRDKAGFIQALNSRFNGRLPIGTLVNGCLYEDCSGEGGDGHIALLGHTDEDGVVWLYHNNWYRPDNEGGVWKEHMVSQEYYYELELRRQWMATPWIKVVRDPATDMIVDVEGLLPEIDDLDPFVGFFITVSIMPELLKELDALPVDELYCPVGYADPILGFCVDGDGKEANVYGPFPEELVERCESRGWGNACRAEQHVQTDTLTLSIQRWSRQAMEALRGPHACAFGLSLDTSINRCIQKRYSEAVVTEVESSDELPEEEMPEVEVERTLLGVDVFGPFDRRLVDRCIDVGGGTACFTSKWDKEFYQRLASALE